MRTVFRVAPGITTSMAGFLDADALATLRRPFLAQEGERFARDPEVALQSNLEGIRADVTPRDNQYRRCWSKEEI
jgi:hypothetical protein